MNTRIAAMTRVWVMVALLVGCPAVATPADRAIVGWGSQVVGVDLSADFAAVAGGVRFIAVA